MTKFLFASLFPNLFEPLSAFGTNCMAKVPSDKDKTQTARRLPTWTTMIFALVARLSVRGFAIWFCTRPLSAS